jgi:hypothetical protein
MRRVTRYLLGLIPCLYLGKTILLLFPTTGRIIWYSHLVPEPPTLTNALSGLNPASRGSNSEAQAAAKSSRVTNGFCDNGCSGKGRFWLAA